MDGKINPNNSWSSLVFMVIYERIVTEISTNCISEESFPIDNEGGQVTCQLHSP